MGASPWSDAALAHLALRGVVGVNLLGHGLARAGSASTFADALVRDFAETWLPSALVWPFALVLPFVELGLGAAILIGLRLRASLLVASALMASLTFGMCLRQQWEAVGLQLIYAIAYALLLAGAQHARGTIDEVRAQRV
ncbi:DoxX family membrane protein [Sandaracinus amylolyticus]|uniref:DoxX family membrane protein n=1 Tax=Sandaracinus amylolyticus TaxID=927083 RepID=UPI001F3AAE43|nr:DoxX family membrane protein [Sandaracinus amylolyticus]UJR84744.1 Hypothetical protein I5071_68230 [Sandaracinus amylolyticus]